MRIALRFCYFGTLVVACALAPASGASGQAIPPEPARVAGETVNVEVKIVPFYAVDAKGNPVYDLKPQEIELRVGGPPFRPSPWTGMRSLPGAPERRRRRRWQPLRGPSFCSSIWCSPRPPASRPISGSRPG
jgi:hypothetical protein